MDHTHKILFTVCVAEVERHYHDEVVIEGDLFYALSETAKGKIGAVKIKIIYGMKSYVRRFGCISHTSSARSYV